ncbi:MAG: carbohydrate ABC transporter permease [Lachnospiraceae bacterium]|jgi:raffinose/stachyose/melibiose transport system permease protein|nr:carbohydrate ABC transporter permease [Lachnospiraceae bacterium]MCH4029000.1 carbohydrate ABC transporter permease [Lachnospiraceae bacterium]MCH4066855.1 carbohydrate ABC transporter permease [Lachnospiraceae bacterium]MCH4112881.1 carbohydrate ABC transporter permease [Lachnospiraceae bacterium]MCI1353448.1 carbohydrate ABC transporter permease [Lachnospiraceae bacterium]
MDKLEPREIDYAKQKRKSIAAWTVAIIFACFQLVITLAPFIFMVLNSFRKQFDMLQQGVFHLPDPWYGQNYIEVVTNGFFGYFIRSVWVVALSLVLMLIIAAFASYPLARMSFRMNALIFAGIVAMMSVPMHVTLIPIFKMTTDIGLYNTDWALIGPYVTFALPMSVFILTAFMKTIPHEIEESAEIDGCNRYQNFFVMILPLSKSGLATLSIYNGVSMWNEFAFANTLLQSPEVKTLPLALGQFKGEHSLDIPMILAVLTLSVLPMIILFIIFQDKLIKGMMAGAVKG